MTVWPPTITVADEITCAVVVVVAFGCDFGGAADPVDGELEQAAARMRVISGAYLRERPGLMVMALSFRRWCLKTRVSVSQVEHTVRYLIDYADTMGPLPAGPRDLRTRSGC